jgi:hypothetical protein
MGIGLGVFYDQVFRMLTEQRALFRKILGAAGSPSLLLLQASLEERKAEQADI